MVYKKRAYKKNTAKTFRRYRSPYQVARRAIANTAECKVTDVTAFDGYITTTATISHLSIISLGTGDPQRNGNFVQASKLGIRLSLESTDAVAVRFILFWDRSSQGSTPATTDLLQTSNFESYRQMNNKTRFTVIKDQVFNMHNYNTTDGSSAMIFKNFFWRLPPRQVGFNDASTTPWTNAIFALLISDIAADAVYARAKSRFWFYDL